MKSLKDREGTDGNNPRRTASGRRGILLAAAGLLAASPAAAYIDPGSAGLPFQNLSPWLAMLAALAGGALLFLRNLWGRFRQWRGRKPLAAALLLLSAFFILLMLRPGMTAPTRVIVIGMDGLDHRLLARWMGEGKLPNFARLAESGSFLPLETVAPPQSPVAWCTFATGANPGVHGVFDFLQRTPDTYYPHLTLLKAAKTGSVWNSVPFEKVRAAPAFWETTSAQKIPTVILRHPVTFPPEKVEGRMLSGLGVPDLSGGLGRYAFYVEAPFDKTADFRGDLVTLKPAGGRLEGSVPGPKDGDKRAELPISVERSSAGAVVRAGGDAWTVPEKSWSPWVRLDFKLGGKSVRGLCRFYLASVAPLRLYQTPLNFDPEKPAFPISHPADYARDLAEAIGPFYTLGMDEDTNALSDEVLSDEAFVSQCHQIIEQRDAMLLAELKRFEKGLLVCVYDTPDRVQHMFWRALDEKHPLHAAAAKQADVILSFYRRLDESLERVLPFVDDETLVLVVSDHGFAPFRRALHLNRWLADNGYLVFSDPGAAPQDFFRGVDWSRTRAYSLGLGGGVYLNLAGREPAGSVPPGQAAALAAEIARKAAALKDPADGEPAVARAALRDEIFSGPLAGNAPDVTLMLSPGYRVSWQTALGGAPKALFEDHKSKWSGDHACSDPAAVPGVLVSNRPLASKTPRLAQVAPTVLRVLGAEPPPSMEPPLELK